MEILYVLALLVMFAMVVGFAVVVALLVLEVARHMRPMGFQTRTEKFAADADRLHRLMHPDEDER